MGPTYLDITVINTAGVPYTVVIDVDDDGNGNEIRVWGPYDKSTPLGKIELTEVPS